VRPGAASRPLCGGVRRQCDSARERRVERPACRVCVPRAGAVRARVRPGRGANTCCRS